MKKRTKLSPGEKRYAEIKKRCGSGLLECVVVNKQFFGVTGIIYLSELTCAPRIILDSFDDDSMFKTNWNVFDVYVPAIDINNGNSWICGANARS